MSVNTAIRHSTTITSVINDGIRNMVLSIPRNNRYGDTDNFCMYLGYYCTGIYKDRNKVRHFTPGGRELKCNYERKSKRTSETDTGETNANL